MKMVWHDDERMQKEPSFIPVIQHYILQERRHLLNLEDATARMSDSGDEKSSDLLWR